MNISYKIATTSLEFEYGKELFQQYANSLKLDLSFQDFTKELETIDIQYNKPKGALLLVYKDKTVIGCAGIREFDIETAELKRMYIQAEYRGCQIGRKLLEQSINIAKELNYKRIRLDTLPDMKLAQKLYRAFGFYEIPSYRFNPIEGTVYMEKNLILV
jgi:ribosomal protein S18 acetylase RimI-like enzyme